MVGYILFNSDDNDASKKYKNNFNLTDAVGKENNYYWINIVLHRNHMVKDDER